MKPFGHRIWLNFRRPYYYYHGLVTPRYPN
jgi:hypothetical protein